MGNVDFVCAICQSRSYIMIYDQKVLSQQDDSQDFMVTDNSYGKHYPIVKCQTCGFVTTLRPDEEYITSKYIDVEDPGYLAEEKNRRLPFKSILTTLKNIGGNTGLLLDIGSFCGLLLDEARTMGFEATGIEPSKWAVEQAKERFDVNIIHSSFPTENDIRNDFEYVTLIDVIEHVSNPLSVLQSIQSLISDDGILAIVTPDFNSLARRIFKERWWHIRIGHLHYFDSHSLNALLDAAGFRIIKTKRYTWRFSFSYLVSRVFNRKGWRWLNRFLNNCKALKWLMNLSVPLNLFDSFECYCQKKDS